MKTVVVVLLLMLPIATSSQEGRPWEELLANVLTAEDLEAATWEEDDAIAQKSSGMFGGSGEKP